MSEFEFIRVETDDRVRTILLNRPDKLNALGPRMEVELKAAIEAANDDRDVRAIILSGAGRAFCAGADISAEAIAEQKTLGHTPPVDRFGYILRGRKPVIAAINGAAVGAGLSIALFCDIRLIADTAKIGSAFARRGLIAEHGSAWLLARLIGPSRALEFLLGGATLAADQAERLGLGTMVPAGDLMERARACAADLATFSSPRSMRVIREQVYASYEQSLDEAIASAFEAQAASLESADFAEGIAAFRERRAAQFPA